MSRSPHKSSEEQDSTHIEIPPELTFKKEVVIVGGGMGGCMSAWKLIKAGWKVTIVESAEEPLLRSANQTPGRMGLGFHYADEETALKYLKATINFINEFKEFDGFRIGGAPKRLEEVDEHYLKHGRYFIVKGSGNIKPSLVEAKPIIDTYRKIRALYADLVEKNLTSDVFGPPDNFFKILTDPRRYSNIVNPDIVHTAVETSEDMLDWTHFRSFFLNLLKKEEEEGNLKIIKNATLIKPAFTHDGQFELTYLSSTNSEHYALKTPYVLNCTWQNAEKINAQLDLKSKYEWTNRLKVLVKVELPPALKEMHSCFFLVGEHCMVSNKGDGTALMSFAPVTNVEQFGMEIPECWNALIENRSENLDVNTLMPDIPKYLRDPSVTLPEELKTYLAAHPDSKDWNHKTLLELYFGQRICEGVSLYVPKMKDAKVLGVQFGIVKTKGGRVELSNKDAEFHKRSYSGVESNRRGWVTNSLMKLLYCVDNGAETLEILERHFRADRQLAHNIWVRHLRKSVSPAVRLSDAISAFWYDRQCDFSSPELRDSPKLLESSKPKENSGSITDPELKVSPKTSENSRSSTESELQENPKSNPDTELRKNSKVSEGSKSSDEEAEEADSTGISPKDEPSPIAPRPKSPALFGKTPPPRNISSSGSKDSAGASLTESTSPKGNNVLTFSPISKNPQNSGAQPEGFSSQSLNGPGK